MISVVLSNYNGAAYLQEAMQSVIDQDYGDFEFIIVDDGSTDASPEIIRTFAEKHTDKVRALIEPKNEGQGAGFNKGIAAARGELVAFMDSDDLWMPCKLRYLAAFAEVSGPAALYQHNLFMIRDGKKTTEPFRPILVTGDVYGDTCDTRKLPSFVATSGLAFPRAILEKVVPIPMGFRTCADGYLTRTSFCHGTVASACEGWGYYRVHDNNSVYGNAEHDNRRYRNNLLIPSLNQYYERIGSELRYPSLVRLRKEKKPAKEQEKKASNTPAKTEETKDPVSEEIPRPERSDDTKFFVKAFVLALLNVSAMDVIRRLRRLLK